MDRFVQWSAETKVESITLKLTEPQANELYNEAYKLAQEVRHFIHDYPQLLAVFEALSSAGVDGTRE